MGIIGGALYFSLSNDWLTVQFKVDEHNWYRRVYYGDSGWGNWI